MANDRSERGGRNDRGRWSRKTEPGIGSGQVESGRPEPSVGSGRIQNEDAEVEGRSDDRAGDTGRSRQQSGRVSRSSRQIRRSNGRASGQMDNGRVLGNDQMVGSDRGGRISPNVEQMERGVAEDAAMETDPSLRGSTGDMSPRGTRLDDRR